MIYVASPYTPYNHADLTAQQVSDAFDNAYMEVLLFVTQQLQHGLPVFSPIVHCHPLAKLTAMPRTWEFWWELNKKYLDASEAVHVACIHGWQVSGGVAAEVKYADKINIPVTYFVKESNGGYREFTKEDR